MLESVALAGLVRPLARPAAASGHSPAGRLHMDDHDDRTTTLPGHDGLRNGNGDGNANGATIAPLPRPKRLGLRRRRRPKRFRVRKLRVLLLLFGLALLALVS